jgi:hypothetical protein
MPKEKHSYLEEVQKKPRRKEEGDYHICSLALGKMCKFYSKRLLKSSNALGCILHGAYFKVVLLHYLFLKQNCT